MNTTVSELDLVQLVKSGDRNAQKMIYSQYIRLLTALCGRYLVDDEDVKDVLQDSFMKIFGTIENFTYKGECSLRAWMSRIVVNQSLDFLQRQGRMNFSPIDQLAEEVSDEPDTSEIPASVIYDLIKQLPDGYRAIFNLYVIEDKSHREIAQMLNIKESTSASQFHRAKNLLAQRIKEYLNNTTI